MDRKDADDELIALGIKDEQGRTIKTVVAERSKSSGTSLGQAKPAALNKKDKNRKRSWKKTDQPYDLTPQNVVSKGAFDHIPPIEWSDSYSCYIKQSFPAATMNLKYPRCSVSKYNTKQAGCAGAPSDHACMIALHLTAFHHARQLGRSVQLQEFGPVNFTTSACVGVPINLLALEEYLNATFPEIATKYSPGVIDMLQLKYKSGVATNISPSGALCSVGFLSRDAISEHRDTHHAPIVAWARANAAAAATKNDSEQPKAKRVKRA
jgi:TATA-box binding protein (TBP) (component of TFIID and TFIIIB)